MIREDVFRHGNKHGPAEELRAEGDGDTGRDVAERQHGLRGDIRLLKSEAETDAVEDLVADPFGFRDADVEGIEEADADGHEEDGQINEGHVGAYFPGEAAGQGDRGDLGEDEGEHVDGGGDGGVAVRGLEPDGEVVD